MKLLILIVVCGWLAAMWKLCFCKQSLNVPPYTFSKDWSYRLKGVLALIIIIHHVSTRFRFSGWWNPEEYPLSYKVISQFLPWGEIVVGLFFFISGYGLLISYKRSGDAYISSFLSKRLTKILIPYVLIELVTQVALVLTKEGYSPWQLLINTYPRGFGFLLWFPIALLLFYLAFYFSFKYMKRIPQSLTLVTVVVVLISLFWYLVGRGEWWWKSNLCFPIGLWYGYCECKITKKMALHPKLWLTLLAMIIIGLARLTRHTHYAFIPLRLIILVFPFFLVCVTYYIKAGRNRVSDFLGKISYEMFLIQFLFLETLTHTPPLIYCTTLVICVLCGASVMQLIDERIYKLLSNETIKHSN